MNLDLRPYSIELIGTFALVLLIGLAAGMDLAGDSAPLAIGLGLTALVYAGGHVSGAHYNPAVTVAFWLRGRFPAAQIVPYIVAQLIGAALAALCVAYFADGPLTAWSFETGPALLAEVLFTFLLCWVILNVASSSGTEGNSFYGVAIGFMVAASAFAVGPISGAVLNPAVAVGLALMGVLGWSSIWIYLLATFVGGALAAVVFRVFVER